MDEIDRLVDALIADAPDDDDVLVLRRSKLAMVDAWCEVAPVLRRRAGARSLGWLARYENDHFVHSFRPARPLGKSEYRRGRPPPRLQQFIDEANVITRKMGLFAEHVLTDVAVLPIGTTGSVSLVEMRAGGPARTAVFQTGLHECIDGLLRAVLTVEEHVPIEAFEQVDFTAAGWQDRYSALVVDSLAQQSALGGFVHILLAETFFGGHPKEVQRYPLSNAAFALHGLLFRHVELFRVGQEIGRAFAAGNRSWWTTTAAIRIGRELSTIALTNDEDGRAADMIAFTLAAAGEGGAPQASHAVTAYARVAPDLCLSLFALLDDALVLLRPASPAARAHGGARERRRQLRGLIEELGDDGVTILGERLQIVVEALQTHALPDLVDMKNRGFDLSPVWHGSDPPPPLESE